MTTLDPRALMDESISEGLEIITNLIDSIKRHGNYSAESTCDFLDQSGQCFRSARAALTALSQPQAGEPDPHSPYMRIVTMFDRDETAASFLSEDGDGGFAGGVYRMAREIDRLRALASPQPANPAQVTDASRVADALEACDWSGPSIGNKAILQKAVELLRSATIGAGGQAAAVKPLEWEPGVVHWAKPLPGMKYVACSTTPAGAWAWWLDDAPETRAVFQSEAEAKAAAQADYERRILSALSQPHPADENWGDDPSADERWNAGLDYGQTQLCAVLGVDPTTINWDAATETLDGDVQSVIGKILTARFGDDWRSSHPADERVVEALRPFAAMADFWDENEPDTTIMDYHDDECSITLGDCRAARAALSAKEGR